MKKTILTTIATVALAGAAYAQGTVNWASITPTYMTAQTNNATYSTFVGGALAGTATGILNGGSGATAITANGFYYALLYQVSGSISASPTTLAGLSSFSASPNQTAKNNTGTAGRLTVDTSSLQSATPVGWDPGVHATFFLAGWSANLGTTWSDVSTKLNNWNANYVSDAYFGLSSSGWIAPNAIGSSGATLFGSTANANGNPINSPNTQLYLLAPVPEPSTMALAALGGASLLLFRRRK